MIHILCECRKVYEFEESMEGKEHICINCGKKNTITQMNDVIALLLMQKANELKERKRIRKFKLLILLALLVVLSVVFIILWNVLDYKTFVAVAIMSMFILLGIIVFLVPGIKYVLEPKRDAVLKINGNPIYMNSHTLGVIFIILGIISITLFVKGLTMMTQ